MAIKDKFGHFYPNTGVRTTLSSLTVTHISQLYWLARHMFRWNFETCSDRVMFAHIFSLFSFEGHFSICHSTGCNCLVWNFNICDLDVILKLPIHHPLGQVYNPFLPKIVKMELWSPGLFQRLLVSSIYSYLGLFSSNCHQTASYC